MADTKDPLEARRWFRQRLAALKKQYPQLTEAEHQQRLTEALEEEGKPCHESQPEEGEEGHQEADS